MKTTVTLIIFFTVFAFGCGDPNLDDPKVREKFIKKAINADDLQMRRTPSAEELPYAPNQESPYTGWVQSNRELWRFEFWRLESEADRQASTKVLAHFQHGKPHGIYISWYGNWQKSEHGSYKSGNRDGAWTMWHENGQKSSERTYKDGNREGLWSEWYSDGTNKSNGQYKDGNREGLWAEWHENGRKSQEGTYREDFRVGDWTWWYESGAKIAKGAFKDGRGWSLVYLPNRFDSLTEFDSVSFEETRINGIAEGKWTFWFSDGDKFVEGNYKDGSREGLWTEWHENGQKSQEGTYKENFRVGDWTWWYESGTKKAKGTFKDGRDWSYVYLGRYSTHDSFLVKNNAEGIWTNGIADGKWTFWYEDGGKFAEGSYKSGNGVGLWTWWYNSGAKYMEGNFRSGKYDIGSTWFGLPAGGPYHSKDVTLFTACGLAVGVWKCWHQYSSSPMRYRLKWEVNIGKNDHGPFVYDKRSYSDSVFDWRLVAKYINRHGQAVTLNKKLE